MSSRNYPALRAWYPLAGALLAALMVLAACGGTSSTTTTTTAASGSESSGSGSSGSESSGSGSSGSGSGEATNSETDDGPQSFEDIEFRSPIGEFFGQDFNFDSEDSEAEFAEMDREAQRKTAECMRALGFEYTPENRETISFGGPGGDVPYFSDEWVTKYGFGITTQRFPQSMVGDLVGFPDDHFSELEEEFVDPNQEYMESLSDGELEAYQQALWGAPPDFGPEGPTEEQMRDFEPSGCQNEAFESVYNSGLGDVGAFYTEFGDELDAMQDRVNADPAVVAYQNEVSSCVTEAGMEYTDMEDLYQRFESELNSLQPGAFSDEDPFAAAGLNPEEMSDREIDEFFQERNRLDPEGLATLAELQAEELELAAVVNECGGGPLQEQAVMADIRVKYEQEFVDANAAEMEKFRSDE